MLNFCVRQLIDLISRVWFSLRLRLLLLVLLACSPLVGLTLHTASRERRQAVSSWRERSQQFARIVRRQEAEAVGRARQLLLALSESASVQSGNPQACQRALDEISANYPRYANLWVVDTNAAVVASIVQPPERTAKIDRALYYRVLASRAFAVGHYFGGSKNRQPSVTFGCPVLDGASRVRAVVFARWTLNLLGRPGSPIAAQVPEAATWTEIDGNGVILARYPASGRAVGEPYPDPGLVRRAFLEPEGLVEASDSGRSRSFSAFARVDSQLVQNRPTSILSIPRPVLFAAANRALASNLTWLGAAVAVALVLGWLGSTFLVLHPVKALVRASARLASGDLSTRTGRRHGKDELGQLTRTFDQMAQALEEREMKRRLAEETLETRDTMFRELPLFPAAVCVCNQFGAVELYNRAAVELWGCEPPDPHASRHFCGAYELFYPDGAAMPHNESPMAEALRSGIPLRNRELMIGRPDGTRVPVLVNVVPLRDAEGSLIGGVSCLQDITERKRTEKHLQDSHDKLQLLSRRLVESQETERRHIARELHDEVGQTLTVAEMNLQAVVQSSRGDATQLRLKDSLQAVERVLTQVRDLSLNLRPSMLDDLGLEPALRWYTTRQASLAGLAVEFHADALEDRLDPVIETACFRVAQEAMTNVVRHARARALSVELRTGNGHLHLCVRDNGRGFDAAALRDRAVQGASLGLLSMEERATLVDGGLELKSVPGQGTEVHAWFPLKWRTPNP